jgi:hypothetical protein
VGGYYIMMKTIRGVAPPAQAIACMAALALGGCQSRPKLVDTLGASVGGQQLSIWDHDVRELAPIIVVASVEKNEVVAKHVEAARYGGVYLDLHVVRCKRENSLKGGLTGPELTFLYFADGRHPGFEPNPIYRRLFRAEPGRRYLFFLTRDRGVLRSIGDVGQYSIPVSTGAHAETPVSDGDVGKRISEILLAPEAGADLGMMAQGMLDYSRIADAWGSRLLTVQLLRNLLPLAEPVRSAACSVLATNYLGQADCLQAVADDVNESPELRQEALSELKRPSVSRRELLAILEDPAHLDQLDYGGSARDSRRRLREELETLLLASDTILRDRACKALKRYCPWDAEPKCPAAKGNPGDP